ncbi:hypothetical protein [Rhizobium sp. 1399]|uniref:hypothetical protein n=1 Tax=Rhizobium sp. 1399 TaxID=2817758 RepID=UPI0028564FF1|nr:hypothetical protein [Rhizobium sp. 1399]MDR6667960.1 hypothetical protein [Rhizobium sp. 1399]
MTLDVMLIHSFERNAYRARAMHDFLEFALNKQPEERISHDEVARWAGALDNWAFYNVTALEIAIGYYRGELDYTFCDGAMNDLWGAVQAGFGPGNIQVPEPFFEIYLAFDAGEYHRKPDKSDNPVADFTNPLIAELVTRLGL